MIAAFLFIVNIWGYDLWAPDELRSNSYERRIRIRSDIFSPFLDAKNPRRMPRVGSVVSVFTDYSATPLLPRSCDMYIDMTMAKTEGRESLITSYM